MEEFKCKPIFSCATTAFHILFAVAVLTALSGCISPGPENQSIAGRYRQVLVEGGPQSRASGKIVEYLRPNPVAPLPELKVERDPQTGRQIIQLSLEEALMRTLTNNLDIQVQTYDTAKARQKLIQAASEFDYTAFGTASYAKQRHLVDSTQAGGNQEENKYEAGIKQKFSTGAEWSLKRRWTKMTENSTTRKFNPSYEPTVEFEVTQPLLRDGGIKLNLSGLRIAKLNEDISVAVFRQTVEEIVRDAMAIYWALVQAHKEVDIQQRLLDKTVETLDRLKARQDLDATSVEIKQAEAARDARKAVLIAAKKFARDVQDRLTRLLSDKQVNLLDDFEILPLTQPETTSINIVTEEQLALALQNNPRLEQARLAVDISDINVYIATRQTLPKLDLTASAGLQGLAKHPGDAEEAFYSGDHPDYGAGLTFEYPLGNRNRLAEKRVSRLERQRSIASMENLADEITVRIKERIAEVNSSILQMEAQHAAVEAARIQLQALEDSEKVRGKMSPEFLLVKLQAQESLADAERAEAQAITDYNTAIVDLAVATGTVLEMPRVKSSIPITSNSAAPLRDAAGETSRNTSGK